MRVTILPNDHFVMIDGLGATVDCSELPLFFHAIHWDGVKGELEFKVDERGVRSGNIVLTSIEPWEFLIERWRLEVAWNKVDAKKLEAEHHERQEEQERAMQVAFENNKKFLAQLNEDRANQLSQVEALEAKHRELEHRISESIARLETLVASRPEGMGNAS